MGLSELLDSQCLTTVLLVVIAVILFLWLIYPQMSSSESFASQLSHPAPAVPVRYIDQNTDTVMDSPQFMQPNFDHNDNPPINVIPPGSYLLDDGRDGNSGLAVAKCSKSCCSAQWPTPFNLDYDPEICANKDKYVANNLTCQNSWQDTGCLCLTEQQYDYLADRGGNANLPDFN